MIHLLPSMPKVRRLGILPFLAAAIISSTSVALGQATGREQLEQRVQTKLDRILTEDEYLIDVKMQSNAASTASSESFLPGLQVLGASPENLSGSPSSIILGGKVDLLLILDKKVSKERARVAQDIVTRIIDSEGLKAFVKFSWQQKDINKIPAPEIPPSPVKDPTVLDQLIKEKDFVARALLVFWGGLVSIMALYFVLRRLLLSGGESGSSSKSTGDGSQAPYQRQDAPPAPAKALKSERTRDEIYSVDEAALNSIKEITEEAKNQPKKIARIVSKWVAQTDDLSRAAALFLRNCDIKTVELVCQAMHPSDLEKVIQHVIEDFQPFSPENLRVVERMRSELAILASEQILRERPDPLNFLKRLSDDDIRHVLEGENENTIALVATQLPAHRLQKFYESVQPESLKAILAQFSSLKSASLTDFEKLHTQLTKKFESIAANLVSEKDRVFSIQQMITAVASPLLQFEMMYELNADNAELYAKVRPSILVATDLRFLSSRVKTMLIQSVEADGLGTALSVFDISFEEMLDGMPEVYKTVFTDAHSRKYDSAVVNTAWKRVATTIYDMVSAGVIGKSEIAGTVMRADNSAAQKTRGDSNSDQGNALSDELKAKESKSDDGGGSRGAA